MEVEAATVLGKYIGAGLAAMTGVGQHEDVPVAQVHGRVIDRVDHRLAGRILGQEQR